MRLKKSIRLYFMLALLVVLLPESFSDEDPRFRRINDALNKFTYRYPQQKVYLHLDKQTYWGGDILWVKAYLVNGMDHLPDTLSTNLYVEIISPTRTRVQIKRFQMVHGFGIGDFALSDTLPEGLYQIRAFTAWMQNFATEFYFEKNFQVLNPGYRKLITPKQARMNVKHIEEMDKEAGDIDLQFMPEGGYLVNGLLSVVAFKAVNQFGKGVDINGKVVDNEGRQVSTFESAFKGLGKISLKPEKGKKYTALFTFGGRERKMALPEAMETGLVMRAEHNGDKIRVFFESNKPETNDPTANELIVTGQIGGQMYYHTIVRLENNKAQVEIPSLNLPGGILQITVFSGRGIPLAERLVYTNPSGSMRIQFAAADSVSDDGNKIVLSILAKNRLNQPLTAHQNTGNASLNYIENISGIG